MQRRRELLLLNLLPPIYQQIDYLQSNGTQYIDTGIFPSNSLGFDCTFTPYSSISGVNGSFGCIFGGRVTTGRKDYQLTTYMKDSYLGTLRNGYSSNNGVEYDAGLLGSGIRQTAKLRNLQYTAPNGTVTAIASYPEYSGKLYSIYLFGLNQSDTFIQSGRGCAIFKMVFYDGNTRIANFVPCVRKSDSEPGMYDTVSKTFYTNAGTGEFIVPA